ncbi:ABC transporter permease [Lactobacillus sp. ESL0791]|uniref:ABC transporter permease n=1 Tax=Lactobacillus sp. ESL0791 TaxID=2983234 RepID=UPI0023F83699|nr:ABC transporter permease [Lactobacillus sp. ESL0791]MDF7638749.1 ABC transporter permease [Lactobacillus sp. ESL0791]
MSEKKNLQKNDKNTKAPISRPTSGFRIAVREIWRDKGARFSLFVLILVLLFTFGGSMFLNKGQVTEFNILDAYQGWGQDGHIFGTDDGGRDIFKLLIMGGRNSIIIGLAVSVICMVIGIVIGLISGYFGGTIDNIIMRIIDFWQLLPPLPIEIVLVTVIPNFSATALVGIISLFSWTRESRFYRAYVLSQRQRDYVLASKTSGSSNLKIMFKEVLPNILSPIITDAILMIAGNIGVETGLSFIGYGLPKNVPSLGTLIGFANDPVNITTRPWLWVPAVVLLLIICLSVNYVGEALQRAGDARQREN